ncbi:MAG: hypothetical protein ACLF0G_00640 [Candidatus Brocadiia bacterium]
MGKWFAMLLAAGASAAAATYRPAFEGEARSGVDAQGGRWRIAFADKKRLAEGQKLATVDWEPDAPWAKHTWGTAGEGGEMVKLGGHGPAGRPGYEKAAVLLFTPPEPGTFAVTGGVQPRDARIQVGKLEADGTYRLVRRVDAKRQRLHIPTEVLPEPVRLGEGESLVFAAWKHSPHFWGEARFHDLAIGPPGKEAEGPAANLLKNGSFEGCTAYWLVRGAVDEEHPAFGQYALRVDEKGLRSASFPLPLGHSYRISLSARAREAGEVRVCIAPSERPTAQKRKYAWNFRYKMQVDREWRRASFVFTPENVTTGSMPESTWILMIGGPNPFWLDGICVTRSGGQEAYVPRGPVEVAAEAPKLPPYTEDGRLLEVGDEVEVVAYLHNPGDEARTARGAWGLLDYEGRGRLEAGSEVALAPGQTVARRRVVKLARRGLTLVRAAALDPRGGEAAEARLLASSDVPLTAVPFPKAATRPDRRERFGGSFRGPLCIRNAQKIGLRWCRWWWGPMGWKAVQPEGPDEWKWAGQDERIALLEDHGMAINYVMYSPPKWALGASNLPRDMQWPADDPRWDDLSVQTSWDVFVTRLLSRYKDKAVAWEFANEPDIHKPAWDPALYYRIVERTSRLVDRHDPDAPFLINATWPGMTGLNRAFLERGGAKLVDAYSWHNYSAGPAASADAMRRLHRWMEVGGDPSTEIWFNEGWTYVNTSHDYPALPLTGKTPAEYAHMTARSAADMMAAGLEKCILFHIGYEQHGKSWWDWTMSGTELWDDHGDPTIAVSVFNVLSHHLGLSRHVATVRPPGAVVHVFHDQRHDQGVAIAWSRKGERRLELPLEGLVARDVVGNDRRVDGPLVLPADGRPFYLLAEPPVDGERMAELLAPLDEEALEKAAGKTVHRPPDPWTGEKPGATRGNPFVADGEPRWRLDRLWPPKPAEPASYQPMPWSGTVWAAADHAHGGQPKAQVNPTSIELSVRTAWPGQPGDKMAALTFIAPQAGRYEVAGTVRARIWDGGAPIALALYKLDRQAGTGQEVASVPLKSGEEKPLADVAVLLAEGQELAFVPVFPGKGLVAANFRLQDLELRFAPAPVPGPAAEEEPQEEPAEKPGVVPAQFQLPPAPADAEGYVTVEDGHLSLDGRRVRFWGCVGGFPGKTHRDNEAVVARLKALGFNLVRFWRGFPEPTSYARGDGSPADLADHFLWCLRQQGMHAWCAGLNRVGKAMPDDVRVVDDPATAEAWRQAVGPEGTKIHRHPARIWDPRLHALGIARMRQIADHGNRYTGQRWADDPVFAIWELSNEEWWFRRMMGGSFLRLPAFFQRELLEQWNEWLGEKYGTEAKLLAAWKFLLPGESLERGTVLLLPLRSEVQAEKQGVALGVRLERPVAQKLGPDDFVAARGSDVIEFLVGIWVRHKQAEHDAVKACGRSTAAAPLCWDTGIGFEMQSQFLHQHADAVAHDSYISGFHHDPTHKRFPWYSGLEELPRLCWDKPWLEHNRFPAKPFLCYENQIHNPAKYRSEYPMRVASLGSIQDWDAIVWHYFGAVPDASKPRPYEHAMDYTHSDHGHPQGLHFQYDEVQMAAMRAAAEVFTRNLLRPAPEPTTFVFGRRSLYAMDKIQYGPVGDLFLPTTYRYGVRLIIDPGREDDAILGPTYKPRVYEPCPIKPTGEIEYHWQRGHLKFDAPGVAMYSGFFAQHGGPVRFGTGVVLRDVVVHNPPDTPYPVGEDERYLTFCLASGDGAPLAEARRAVLAAVSTSFNSGFELNHEKIRREFGWWWNKGATVSRGGLPVLVSRVGATIECPMLEGMRVRLLDWHLRPIDTGTVRDGVLRIDPRKPTFVIELERP